MIRLRNRTCVTRAIACIASATVGVVVVSMSSAGVAMADGPNTVAPGYSAQALNSAQGPLLTLKIAASVAYSRWKIDGGSWGDFVTAETAFDRAAGIPAGNDSLLTTGGSKATAATVSAPRASANSVQPNVNIGNYMQYPESKEYYCGPAAAMQILGGLGYDTSHYNYNDYLSQATLAKTTYLQTDQNQGTNWYPAVMAPTLNKWMGSSYYVTLAAPSTSSVEISTMQDVDHDYSLADNIVETGTGYTHLSGYPTNSTKYHWQSVFGYTNSGANVDIADPAYSPYVTWGHNAGMSATRWISADQLRALVASRGIVW